MYVYTLTKHNSTICATKGRVRELDFKTFKDSPLVALVVDREPDTYVIHVPLSDVFHYDGTPFEPPRYEEKSDEHGWKA